MGLAPMGLAPIAVAATKGDRRRLRSHRNRRGEYIAC
jgi:hypothetical protein